MEIIQLILAAAMLGIVYKKMIKAVEISKKQAYVPIVLGVVATVLSFFMVLAMALTMLNFGYTTGDVENLTIKALLSAFLKAGLMEEIAKLLMILLAIRLFRPKNVYECALIGGAVGIGFTLHEEFLYGGSLVGLTRLLTVFMHTALGVIMGRYIGIGMYNKKNGTEHKKYYALALIIPMAIHTLYDALVAYNPALKEGDNLDETISAMWLLTGVMGILFATVWQWIVIRKFRKKSEEYLAMRLYEGARHEKDCDSH